MSLHAPFRLTSAALFLLAALAAPVFAQSPLTPTPPGRPSPNATPDGKWVQPPSDLPKASRADRTRNIDFLFGALKAAPDDESAKAVENRIWALWMVSGSDTADLLMSRAKTAADAKDYNLAIRLLGTVIELRPNYVDAWNRRATIYFLKRDYGSSLADIRQVLAREPRHFGALAGLGVIMEEVGNEKQALDAFRKAESVYPRLGGLSDQIKNLKEKVEGRDI
jgi:tetratricopeptide (TPR) repeat protein